MDVDMKAGTINHVKLDIPTGYHMSSCLCTAGIQVHGPITYSDYSKTDTPISYSFTQNGDVYYAPTKDTQAAGRFVYIVGFLSKN